MKQIQSIITYDAFDSQESFEKASESIFLDITDKSREDMKDYRNVPHIFKTHLFQSITELPTNVFESSEYIYTLEVDNGKFLKIGTTNTLTETLSELKDRYGRITIVGPLRDASNTEQIIQGYMRRFYTKEDVSTDNLYPLDKFEANMKSLQETNSVSDKDNIFELFNGIATNPNFKLINDNAGIFGLMQSWYYGESLDTCLYPQDLILPKVKY